MSGINEIIVRTVLAVPCDFVRRRLGQFPEAMTGVSRPGLVTLMDGLRYEF